jgi:hypothetical protein
MALQGHIKWDEGELTTARGPDDSAVLNYFVHSDNNTDTRTEVVDWLSNNAPSTFNGMLQNKITVRSRIADTDNPSVTEQIWDAVVEYVPPQKAKQKPMTPQDGSAGSKATFRLSIRSSAGESKLMTFSKELIDVVEFNEPMWKWERYDVARLLNLQLDNSSDTAGGMFTAKGITVPIGGVEIVVEKRFEDTFLIGPSFSVLQDMAGYAGKQVVNSDNWKGWDAGSLKFINFECSQEGGQDSSTQQNTEAWSFTYTFAYSPTITAAELNENLPPGLAGGADQFTFDKKGWHYLDTLFVDGSRDIQGFQFKLPSARRMSIQRIYDEINFSNELYI